MSDNNILEEDYLNELLNSIMELENDTKQKSSADEADEENKSKTDIENEVVLDDTKSAIEELSITDDNLTENFYEEINSDIENQIENDDIINDDAFSNNNLSDENINDSNIINNLNDNNLNNNQPDKKDPKNKNKENKFLSIFNRIFSKKDKKNKDKKSKDNKNDDNNDDNNQIIKEFDEESKSSKKSKKKKSKKTKEKRSKKPKIKEKEIDEVIKISLKGVAFTLTMIVIFILVVTLGVNIFSYTQKINKSYTYYLNKEYNKAFELIAGEELKDSDLSYYKQIRTIMYIDKDYQSYENFKQLKMDAQALDSLIKGVANYYKYKDQAQELGVLEDMQYILDMINIELKSEYDLTEDEAVELEKISDRNEYSKQIYKIIDERS